MVGNDFGEFLGDKLRVDWLTTNRCKSLSSLLMLALLDKVTRRLRQEGNATSEDESPQELDSHRDTVGTTVHAVLSSVDDNRSEEDTDGDAELVAGDEGATNLSGADLGHVQDDDGGLEANTKSSDETTGSHEGNGG